MAQVKTPKTKIRDLNPAGYMAGEGLRFVEYQNLLLNAVHIKSMDYTTEVFVKRRLLEGSVGFDKLTNKWASVYGEGLDEKGNPLTLRFVFPNGKAFSRVASYEPNETGAYLINALPVPYSLNSLIKETTEFMNNCDVAIRQNLEACKTPYIVVSKNKDMQLSIETALQQKQTGQAVIVVSEDLGDALKAVNVGTTYLCDKFKELRDGERDHLLNKIGIMSANTSKRERVQVGEVNATLSQVTDYIYLLIDTFNAQCKSYGLPFEMELNGSLEELYTPAEEAPNVDDMNAPTGKETSNYD